MTCIITNVLFNWGFSRQPQLVLDSYEQMSAIIIVRPVRWTANAFTMAEVFAWTSPSNGSLTVTMLTMGGGLNYLSLY